MGYVRTAGALGGCGCKAKTSAPATSGCGCHGVGGIIHGGVGDDPAAITAGPPSSVAVLEAQLNRFADPAAPPAFLIFTTPLASGKITADMAGRSAAIILRRSIESPDAKDLAAQAGKDAAFGGLDPIVWVQKNLDRITQIVSGYGDTHGLPPAVVVSSSIFDDPRAKTIGLVAGAGLALYLFFGQKSKRSKRRRR